MKVLLDAGAVPNTLNHDDNSPIHLAITGGQLRRQQMLSRGVPEDVRFAAALGDMEGLARHFDRRGRLQDDAIPGLDASDRKQRRRTLDSALQFAAHWGQIEAASFLLERVQTLMVSLPACMGLGIRGPRSSTGSHGREQGTMLRWVMTQGADPMKTRPTMTRRWSGRDTAKQTVSTALWRSSRAGERRTRTERSIL